MSNNRHKDGAKMARKARKREARLAAFTWADGTIMTHALRRARQRNAECRGWARGANSLALRWKLQNADRLEKARSMPERYSLGGYASGANSPMNPDKDMMGTLTGRFSAENPPVSNPPSSAKTAAMMDAAAKRSDVVRVFSPDGGHDVIDGRHEGVPAEVERRDKAPPFMTRDELQRMRRSEAARKAAATRKANKLAKSNEQP